MQPDRPHTKLQRKGKGHRVRRKGDAGEVLRDPVGGGTGSTELLHAGDDLRAPLPPLRFVEFSEEVHKLYAECLEITRGAFLLVCYHTDALRTKWLIPGVPPATRAPAQFIGWIAVFMPFRIFHPMKDTVITAPFADPQGQKRYEWGTVVDLEHAEQALVPVLRIARDQLKLAVIRATAHGATV